MEWYSRWVTGTPPAVQFSTVDAVVVTIGSSAFITVSTLSCPHLMISCSPILQKAKTKRSHPSSLLDHVTGTPKKFSLLSTLYLPLTLYLRVNRRAPAALARCYTRSMFVVWFSQRIFTSGGRLCDDDSAILEAHKANPDGGHKMFMLGALQYDTLWYDRICYGMIEYGTVFCGVLYGKIRFGAVWCGTVWPSDVTCCNLHLPSYRASFLPRVLIVSLYR